MLKLKIVVTLNVNKDKILEKLSDKLQAAGVRVSPKILDRIAEELVRIIIRVNRINIGESAALLGVAIGNLLEDIGRKEKVPIKILKQTFFDLLEIYDAKFT